VSDPVTLMPRTAVSPEGRFETSVGRTDPRPSGEVLVRLRQRFRLLGGAGAARNARAALERRAAVQREAEQALSRIGAGAPAGVAGRVRA
jgi:hypothetical protein